GSCRTEYPGPLQDEQQDRDQDDRDSLNIAVIPMQVIDQEQENAEIDQVTDRVGAQVPRQGRARGALVSKRPASVDQEGLQDAEQVEHRHRRLGLPAERGRSEVEQVEYDVRPDAGQGIAEELARYRHAITCGSSSAT